MCLWISAWLSISVPFPALSVHPEPGVWGPHCRDHTYTLICSVQCFPPGLRSKGLLLAHEYGGIRAAKAFRAFKWGQCSPSTLPWALCLFFSPARCPHHQSAPAEPLCKPYKCPLVSRRLESRTLQAPPPSLVNNVLLSSPVQCAYFAPGLLVLSYFVIKRKHLFQVV